MKNIIKLESINYEFDKIPKEHYLNDMELINELYYQIFKENCSVEESFAELEAYYDISLDHIKNKMIEDALIKDETPKKLIVTDKGINFYETMKIKIKFSLNVHTIIFILVNFLNIV